LTETGGEYILKPIPPSTQLVLREQAPENEHLSMQMATQLFGIRTAANALIYFQDGTAAYYGQADFRALTDKIGLVPVRRDQILTLTLHQFLSVLDIAAVFV